MFGRRRRQNRRGIGGGLGQFLPTQLSGCVLWLRADLGITSVDAAQPSPNDISTGTWSPTGVLSRTATTFTEDSSTGLHVVADSGLSGVQINHVAHYRIELPSNPSGRYVCVLANSGAHLCGVDTVAGTIVSAHANILNETYVDHVLEFDTVIVGATIYICGSTDGSTISYTGNGTRTFQVGPGRNGHDAIEVTQRTISAWADQSGAGNHFTQSAAANRPSLVLDGGYAGNPAVYFDGASDGLVSSMSQAQPFTMFAAGHLVSQAARMLVGASAPAMYWGANSGTSIAFNLGGTQISATYDATQRTVHSIVANTASSRIRANGIDKATGPVGAGSLVSPAVGVTPGLGFYWYGWIPEVIAYNRELSAAEYAFVERKLGARYGIAVA